MQIERHATDILILGSGGAGLFAALHALQTNAELDMTVAVKLTVRPSCDVCVLFILRS